MNITGNWIYREDFEYGKSKGNVTLNQSGKEVEGIFTFTEEIENNYKIEVKEKVRGTISGKKVLLKSYEVKATQNNEDVNYLPNNFEVYIVSDAKLVGSTYDSDNICGVFVLERM